MDALLGVVRSAAAESIMLSDRPLVLAALFKEVKQRLDPSTSERVALLGDSFLVERRKRSPRCPVGRSEEAAACGGGADMALNVMLKTLMLMDQQFCVSEGGYCLYPCRPSLMVGCSSVDTIFSAFLRDGSSVLAQQAFCQYRRRFGYLAHAAATNCTSSFFPLIGRHQSLVAGVQTTPIFHSWVEKWKNVMVRFPNRSIAFNSIEKQHRLARFEEWNRDVMQPIAHGLITAPISLRALEHLLGYQTFPHQKRIMPFRRWIEYGLLDHTLSHRRSVDHFLGVSQLKQIQKEVVQQRPCGSVPTTRRSLRQYAPQLYASCVSQLRPDDPASFEWNHDKLTKVRARQTMPATLYAFPRDLGEDTTRQGWMDHVEDKDVMVFPDSIATFAATFLPLIRQMQGNPPHQRSPPSEGAGSEHVLVADVAKMALWTHEYGEVCANQWMTMYLRKFPTLVDVSTDGIRVRASHRR